MNATAFPGKWEGGTISDDDDYLADDIETWSANWGSNEQIGFFNVITERISRYPTSEDAYELFTNLIRTDQNPDDLPYRRSLDYQNAIADHQAMLCRYHIPAPNGQKERSFCTAYTQYDSYVVQLSAYIDNHLLGYTDLEDILQKIDTQMAVLASEKSSTKRGGPTCRFS